MRATVVPVGAEIIFGAKHTDAIAQSCRRLQRRSHCGHCVCAATGDQYLARFRLEDTSSQES